MILRQSAVSFIRKHKAQGNRVYVHCRAGHGRSAAGVFAWLIDKDPIVDLRELNAGFCKLRNVRKTLWKQANIQELHSRLMRTGKLTGSSDADGPSPRFDIGDSSERSEDEF
jgi:protein-tyrosine phosphatase